MRTVLVVNPKGGCGKTTLSTNLAGALADRGDSVVLWDLDRQKSSLEWLALRSPELPVIHSIEPKDEPSGKEKRKHDWMVIDTPQAALTTALISACTPKCTTCRR